MVDYLASLLHQLASRQPDTSWQVARLTPVCKSPELEAPRLLNTTLDAQWNVCVSAHSHRARLLQVPSPLRVQQQLSHLCLSTLRHRLRRRPVRQRPPKLFLRSASCGTPPVRCVTKTNDVVHNFLHASTLHPPCLLDLHHNGFVSFLSDVS